MSYQPLADKIRPRELDEMVGQQHIIGENGVLRRILENGSVPNLIFYGPSGTGKTTLAQIIAGKTHRQLVKLNATTASTADIRAVTGQLDTLLAPEGVLLYLDEIQYFNKKQQQSLLEFIENGKITLIASTTENPYFYVYNAILSRSTIFEFKPIQIADTEKAVERAFRLWGQEQGRTVETEPGVVTYLSEACGGDIRKAVNAVELLCAAGGKEGPVKATLADARAIAQKSANRYDREGDAHFDLVSALMKSMRGSDPDAAVHYLARLLEAGDLIGACRRILCSASEDIGLAYQGLRRQRAAAGAAGGAASSERGGDPAFHLAQVQQCLPGDRPCPGGCAGGQGPHRAPGAAECPCRRHRLRTGAGLSLSP